MTKQEITNGTRKAVKDGVDIQVSCAVDWLMDYGLISWKHRTAILDGISKAREITQEAVEQP